MKAGKTYQRILSGSRNIRFNDMITLVRAFGFEFIRQEGSHQIYYREGISKLINLQNANGEAKAYQINQFLKLIEEFQLTLGD